jgi:hypothetical protein
MYAFLIERISENFPGKPSLVITQRLNIPERRINMRRKLLYLATLTFVFAAGGNIRADLVAHWKMDEDGGNTIVDSSRNGHDGVLNGTPAWVAGQLDLALYCDGASTYAQVPASPNLDLLNHGDFSIAVWLTTDELTTEYQAALQQTDGNGTGRTWLGFKNGDFYNYHGGADRLAGVTIEAQTWYHVAYVVTEGGTNDTIQYYINGEPTNSHTTSVESNDNGDYLIGCHKALGNFWYGLIDDVRLYNHALKEVQVLAAMEGREDYPFAYGPDPADGALYPNTWVNLSWSPGEFAVSHNVYMGDNFDEVDNGTGDTFRGNQTSTMLIVGFPGFPYPEGLVSGTTYYWRIDEVNEANANSPWKGPVWSFSIPPKTAYDPHPADGAEFVDPNNVTLTWTPGFGAILHTAYIGNDFDQVSNATGGTPLGSASYQPGPLEREKVYYWRIDEFDGVATHIGHIWSFTTPGAVGNPQPAYNTTDAPLNTILSWAPADNAASHELYVGTDKALVRNADTSSPEYKGSRALGAESYDPGLLEADTTYYWRVDEIDGQGNTVKGPLWIFTTGGFLLVDDFESYTDDDAAGEAIWQTWIDGFGIADNGAQVGYLLPPYAEQTIVHGGSQSMPLLYTNEAGVTNSEAALTLTTPRDWTQAGITELSFWFRGASGNAAEPLYIAISNSAGTPAILAHDDPDAATARSWTQWNIPLQTFADQGLNLTNVDKIAIGLGSKSGVAFVGGSGTMYIDDIRLQR